MSSISKHLDTIKKLFDKKRNVKKDDPKIQDMEEDEEFVDDFDDEDANPGNVRLNDGQRDKTLGINKKIVNTVLISIGLIIAVAWFYNMSDDKEKAENQRANEQMQQTEQVADRHKAPNEMDYKAAQARLMQQANSKNGAQQGQNQPAQNAQQPQQAVNTQQLPQIRGGYSAPYALPNQVPVVAQPNAKSNEEREAEQKEKSLAERFRSAIAFGIGLQGSSGSDDASDQNSMGISGSAPNYGVNNVNYYAPASTVIQAGTMIPAILFSGINTDNPGQVIAQVECDVYDSATGSQLIIPAGSRVIGTYSENGGGNASGRVNVTFNTMVLPNGGSFSIGSSMVAVDGNGYNGIRGNINSHAGKVLSNTFTKGLLSSALTALSTIGARRATVDTSGIQNLLASEKIAPTITVDPGCQFNLFVTQPISFNY